MVEGKAFPPWNTAQASEIIAASGASPDQLLPLLQALQEAFGHVPPAATPLLALALNLSQAEVHGVISFYHDFRRVPPQGRTVRLCRAEACQARGGRVTEQALKVAIANLDASDGPQSVTLEAVYCLGLCAIGPAALVDGRPVARLEGARLARLIEELAS